jgi:hypothetical protein
VITELAQAMLHRRYAEEEHFGEPGVCYIIMHGLVWKDLRIISTGAYFGMDHLLVSAEPLLRSNHAVGIVLTQCSELTKEAFESTFRARPEQSRLVRRYALRLAIQHAGRYIIRNRLRSNSVWDSPASPTEPFPGSLTSHVQDNLEARYRDKMLRRQISSSSNHNNLGELQRQNSNTSNQMVCDTCEKSSHGEERNSHVDKHDAMVTMLEQQAELIKKVSELTQQQQKLIVQQQILAKQMDALTRAKGVSATPQVCDFEAGIMHL